jgi:hypothetical protein
MTISKENGSMKRRKLEEFADVPLEIAVAVAGVTESPDG